MITPRQTEQSNINVMLNRTFSYLGILLLPTLPQAASLQQCIDDNGHITFTQMGCPPGQQSQHRQVNNPPPGSVVTQPSGRTNLSSPQLVIVGSQDDGCGNRLDSRERRRAIVRQQILPGMSQADVERALGKPDSVSVRNGKTQMIYEDKGNSKKARISLDNNGCVLP